MRNDMAQWFWMGSLSSCQVKIFCQYRLLEKRVSLTCSTLNSLHLGMLCVTFDWNWPSGSKGEEETVKVDRQTERQTNRRTDWWTDDGRFKLRVAKIVFSSFFSSSYSLIQCFKSYHIRVRSLVKMFICSM